MGEPEPIKPIPISKLRNGTKKANEQTIKIATWNIKRGLLKRELEIIELIESEKIDLLFLTETDIVLESESEYKIKGFNTFFPARENNTDQIRIIALLRTSLEENIKIKNEIMCEEFPSIWFEQSEANKANTYFAGFYRQWSYKGVKSESLQIRQIKIFANQIDIVSRITNKIIIIGDANLDSTTWNNENFLNKKIAVPLKNSLEQNGMLNDDSIGNTYFCV